jgi:hypothetical protein
MEAIEHLPHHAQLELFLYVLKKTVFLFILLEIFAGWTNAYARHSGTKWFNEVSVAGGVQ